MEVVHVLGCCAVEVVDRLVVVGERVDAVVFVH